MADDKKTKGAAPKSAPPKGGKVTKGEGKGKGSGPSGPVTEGRPESLKVKPRQETVYLEKVRPALMAHFKYTSLMQAPRIQKIVLNIGAGEGASDQKKIQSAQNDLTAIAGQKAVITRAKKAIAAFKITAGRPVGVRVTLRKDRMYEFLDRLITQALPRVRDFRGLNAKSFDGRGNFSMGLKEHIVFPEIDYDKVDTFWGLDVVVCTTARTDDEARALLKLFNFPLT